MKNFKLIAAALAFYGTSNFCLAQHSHGDHRDTELHVNPRWKECSFQLDPSLTQDAWREFTEEASLVAYLRPITDAKPLGRWNFEVSLLQWRTKFDDTKPAWNDTFVHPDSVHWLKEGSRLPFPGITGRVGITDRMDVGVYFTKSPGANYGFWGGHVQYNLVNNLEKKWSASARISFNSLYGPEDLKLGVCGLDLIASKEFPAFFDWASISPYVGVSSYLSYARETSSRVNLEDEGAAGSQAMVGAVLKLSKAQLGVEYNFAKLNTVSFRIGVVL
jgi:prepilin-type processing-associated H-X9-DG protein